MIIMKKRHTIILDEKITRQLREIQASLIKKTGKSVSFSGVIEQLLRKTLEDENLIATL